MIESLARVHCDNCKKTVLVNYSGGNLGAWREIERRGWIAHSVGYGNVVEVCGRTCLDAMINASFVSPLPVAEMNPVVEGT